MINSKSVSLVQVIAATVNLMEPLSTYNAKEIIVHSEYDVFDSWRNDIALIEIEGEFITTALLNYVQLANANQKIPAESPAIVSGWGRTSVSELIFGKKNIIKSLYLCLFYYFSKCHYR